MKIVVEKIEESDERVGRLSRERAAHSGVKRLLWSVGPSGLWIRVGVFAVVLAFAQIWHQAA